MQNGHLCGRARKVTALLQLRTAPSMEICANSGLPLHRYNVCSNAGAYENEAKVLVNLKMQTMARCKKGTFEDGPANYIFWFNYAQHRQWKFAQIRGYLYTGTILPPMQGAYEKEAEVLVNLKMQTMSRCKEGTFEDGTANYPLCCNYAQSRQWKYAQIRGCL